MIERLWTWMTSSLQRRLTLLILAAMSVLLATFITYDISVQQKSMEDALLAKGKSMAQNGALAMSRILEEAIASGRLTEAQVFDTAYQAVPDTNPQKFHTAYDSFTDQNFLALEDGYLEDEDVGFAVAVDTNGYLPTHNTKYSKPLTGDPEKDTVGNRTKRIFNDPTGIAAARNSEPVLQQIYYRDTGEVMWDISAPIMVHGKHWGGFRIGFSLARINALLAGITQRILLAALLLVALLAIVVYLLVRPVGRAARLMASTADQIAQEDLPALAALAAALASGDLTQTAKMQPHTINYTSRDEMGILARSFNAMTTKMQETGGSFAQMTSNLRDMVGRVANSAMTLSQAANQLSISTVQSGQAANQISIAIQQVSRGIGHQTDSVTKTALSTEQTSLAASGVAQGAREEAEVVSEAATVTSEISSAIEYVANKVRDQVANSTETVKNTQASAQIVQNTARGMHKIKEKVDFSTRKVQEMGSHSDQIGAIVEVIEDIASQTNLLALNAAIEAARAGESGKGFAVVAEEVRKLAERSASSTHEITSLVQSIQRTIREAVQAMTESAAEVESGVTLAEQSEGTLSTILQATESELKIGVDICASAEKMSALANKLISNMDRVSSVSRDNTAATERIAAGSNEILQAVEVIATVSEENNAALEEVSASTEEMSAQAEEVSASVQELSAMAQMLQRLVSQFKLGSDTF